MASNRQLIHRIINLFTVAIIVFAVFIFGANHVSAASEFVPSARLYDTHPAADSSASEYVLGAKWDKSEVTYSFLNCPKNIDCGTAHQLIREAAEEWDAVCGLSLTEVASGGDIQIGWFSGSHGDGEPFDGLGDVLAHAFFPKSFLGSLAGDLHFDDDERWVNGNDSGPFEVDLKTTARHELGHSLGLDHSGDPNALMWLEYVGQRAIQADDVAGIQALYGPPSPDEAQAVPPLAPTGVTATATVTAKVRTGPDTSAAEVGKILQGSTVNVYGRNSNSDWLYVEASGLQGWSAGWLFLLNGDINALPVIDPNSGQAPTPPTVPTTPPTDGTVLGISIDKVKVRLGPDVSYPELGIIPQGATVVVLARNDGYSWVVINYNGLQGWAAAWLFKFNSSLQSLPVQ